MVYYQLIWIKHMSVSDATITEGQGEAGPAAEKQAEAQKADGAKQAQVFDSYLNGGKEHNSDHFGIVNKAVAATADWLESGDTEMSDNPAVRAYRGTVGAIRGMLDGVGSTAIALAPHIPMTNAPFAVTPAAIENQKAEIALNSTLSDDINNLKNEKLDDFSDYILADHQSPEYRAAFAGGVATDIALGLGIGKNILTRSHGISLSLDQFEDFQLAAEINLKYLPQEEKPYQAVFRFINIQNDEVAAKTSVLKSNEFWQVLHDLRDHVASLGIPDFEDAFQHTGMLSEDIAFVSKRAVKKYSFGPNIFGQMQIPYSKFRFTTPLDASYEAKLTISNYVQNFPRQTLMQNKEFFKDTVSYDKILAEFAFGDRENAHTLGVSAIENMEFPKNFTPGDFTYRFSNRYTGALVDANIKAARGYRTFLDARKNKVNPQPYENFFQTLQKISDDIKAGKLAD
jgi:hypothetical protein